MAAFPRDKAPRDVGDLEGLRGERTRSQGGIWQRRATPTRGWRWEERWGLMIAGEPEIEKLRRFIRVNALRESSFTVKHLEAPGSRKAPNGTGTAGVTVNGADQTGSSLDTQGWPTGTTNVVRDGDVIKIGGIDHVFMVTADADSDGSGLATIEIAPSIFVGGSPADSAAITTTDVEFTAMIADYTMPSARPGDFLDGLVVRFQELPS